MLRLQDNTVHRSPSTRQRGIVLPIVLVMLVLMTTVVLFLIRRGTVDEQLAANIRGVVTMETAAQYGLRYCELWLWTSPPGTAAQAGRPDPPRTMPPPAPANPPAWRDANNWANNAVTLPAASMGPNVSRAQCLIEDASGELDVTTDTVDGNRLASEASWRKYRVTVEVEGAGPDGLRLARAQSELRMYVN